MTNTYETTGYPVNLEVKETSLTLPFFNYYKKVTKDPETGKKKVEKRFTRKSYEDIASDAAIIIVTAGAINAIGNGLAHFIYACKKKKNK